MELERTSQRTEQRDAVALLQIGEERRAFPDGPIDDLDDAANR